MLNENVVRSEEKAIFALRSLYRTYGFLPFKMNKFEEYDIYVKNKDFLVSDSVITFNDTNGKLLALKPDVTLSIVNGYRYEPSKKRRLFYNENVYRISAKTHRYKEIMQTGLECIGDIDLFDITEVLLLALSSLELFETDFVLDVSHMGLVSSILEKTGGNDEFKSRIMHCLGEKNSHEIEKICAEYEISSDDARLIKRLVGIYGKPEDVEKKLAALALCDEAKTALDELERVWNVVKRTPLSSHIRFDFSIVNDMNYYNGVVFTGFLKGVPQSVLSGGRYDKLLKKMGKKGSAIGFAVYLDLLDAIREKANEYDTDVVLLYNDKCSLVDLFEKVHYLTERGYTVSALKEIPQDLKYKKIIEMEEEE